MKAVIMAGGEGTRLRPLTCAYPKPMANIGGLPLMEHILGLLNTHGFEKAAVTLQYMPEKIRGYFGGESAGLRLDYFEERTPLGTAGSVKNCGSFLDEDFLVISGDSLCDFHLSSAIDFHKKKNADVTLVLYRVDNPLEYGVTLTDQGGKITEFIEKPSWASAFSDTVNTGIYLFKKECLDLIPENTPFDFARDLFPLMMASGKRLFGYVSGGYWNDIGSGGAYLSSCIDLMDKKVGCKIPYPQIASGICSGSVIPDGVRLFPPCIIGKDVCLSPGAVIGPHAFLGDGAVIGERAGIKRSVVLSGARIGAGVQARGAIVCERAVLKDRVSLYEGTIIGAETVVGADSEIMPHVRLWPQKHIKDKTCVRRNIVWGTGYDGLFSEEGVTGDFGFELTPEYAARLGAAVAFVKKGALIVAYEGENDAALLADALCSGIRSAGLECSLSPGLPASLLRFAAHRFGFAAGIHIQSPDGKGAIRLFDGDGFELCRMDERKVEAAFLREDYRRARSKDIPPLSRLDGVGMLYSREIREACGDVSGLAAAFAKNDYLSAVLSKAAADAGCLLKKRPSDGAVCFDIDAASGSLAVWDEKGDYHPPEQTQALIAKTLTERNLPVYLPFEAPLVIDAAALEKRPLRVLPDDNLNREGYSRCPAMFDPGFGMAEILKACKKSPLWELFRSLPSFGVATAILEADTNKGTVMRRLSAESEEGQRKGVRLKTETGNVLIVPMRKKDGFFIRAESHSMEAAKELCADMGKRINLYEKDKEK